MRVVGAGEAQVSGFRPRDRCSTFQRCDLYCVRLIREDQAILKQVVLLVGQTLAGGLFLHGFELLNGQNIDCDTANSWWPLETPGCALHNQLEAARVWRN